MEAFEYEALPARVIFGEGSLERVRDSVEAMDGRRVFLIHSPSAVAAATRLRDQLSRIADVRPWPEVVQHVPVELAIRARAAVDEQRSDLVVSVGGGSSTGLAKAIALSHGLPIIAVPTTYAGSELTPIYGLTGEGHKETGKSVLVMPRVVVYDPLLTLGLPPAVTGPSAFNALAHCVEALYAPGHNPVTSAIALQGVEAINGALPRVMREPAGADARGDLLYGSMLAGMSLGMTASGFHHRLCHILGGKFGLTHADTHSAILPHAVAFNAPALPREMSALARSLGQPGGEPAGALWDLARASGIPTDLARLGLPRDGLPEVAREIVAEEKNNPVALNERDVLKLLDAAFEGVRPTSRISAVPRAGRD